MHKSLILLSLALLPAQGAAPASAPAAEAVPAAPDASAVAAVMADDDVAEEVSPAEAAKPAEPARQAAPAAESAKAPEVAEPAKDAEAQVSQETTTAEATEEEETATEEPTPLPDVDISTIPDAPAPEVAPAEAASQLDALMGRLQPVQAFLHGLRTTDAQGEAVRQSLETHLRRLATGEESMTDYAYLPEFCELCDCVGRSAPENCIKALLSAGADVNAGGPSGLTALSFAVRTGQRRLLVLLLLGGADPSPHTGGDPELFYAVELVPVSDAADITSILLGAGADPNARDAQTRTLLQRAIARRSPALVKRLLDAGATAGTWCIGSPRYLRQTGGPEVNAINHEFPLHLVCKALPAGAQEREVAAVCEMAQMLLAAKADANARNAKGETPLLLALQAGCEPLARALLQGGAKTSLATPDGVTPLGVAVAAGRMDLVRLLLENGAKPDAPLARGEEARPLEQAMRSGNLELGQALLAAGASTSRRFGDGETPLTQGLKMPDGAWCRLLVRYGADVNQTNRAGLTPLQICVESAKGGIVDWLLDQGASLDLRTPALRAGMPAGWMALEGETPLHQAAHVGSVMVEKLLKCGALGQVKARRADGATPLHLAAEMRSDDRSRSVMLLLAAGADPNAIDKAHETPLHRAVESGSVVSARLLLAAGAEVEAETTAGLTPLHMAAMLPERTGRTGQGGDGATRTTPSEMIRLLLTAGADPGAGDADGCTPLALAVREANLESARLLLGRSKGKLHSVTHSGESLLHLAAENPKNGEAMAEMLLEAGANLNALTPDGWLPLHTAASGGSAELLECLLRHGANPYAVTSAGESAIALAEASGDEERARLLRDAAAALEEGASENAPAPAP